MELEVAWVVKSATRQAIFELKFSKLKYVFPMFYWTSLVFDTW